jgi:hypothetical protein
MPKRKKHPHKDIEDAIIYAESKGWRYKDVGKSSHAWGRLLCPTQGREGCAMSIWSTPRNAFVHAEQIRRRIKVCPH